MAKEESQPLRPDGIEPSHCDPGSAWLGAASFVLLLALVAFGLSGLAGSRQSDHVADAGAARLSVRTPEIVRNGEVYETTVLVDARRRIGKLVLAVAPDLWRDTTVNSMVPAAGDESFEEGLFRFDYGELKAGDRFEVKVALQVNPNVWGTHRGRLAVFDDKARLAELPLTLRIRP